MSEEARVWAKKQSAPCAVSKALLLELAAMANTRGECWPSIRFLAGLFNLAPRSIQRHVAKLRDAGLIVAEVQTRPNGGQSSNLYRLPLSEPYRHAALEEEAGRTPHDTSVTPPHDAAVAPPTTQASPPLGRETLTQETSDEVSPRKRDVDAEFARFWTIYPRKAERHAALKLFDRIVRHRLATADELVAGAQRYAIAVHLRDEAMIKHPTTWLQRECWLEGGDPAGEQSQAAPSHGFSRNSFAGPAELRSAIVSERGEAWVVSWIDPCGWDDAGKALIPNSGYAADRIRQELLRQLRSWGVGITQPHRRDQ